MEKRKVLNDHPCHIDHIKHIILLTPACDTSTNTNEKRGLDIVARKCVRDKKWAKHSQFTHAFSKKYLYGYDYSFHFFTIIHYLCIYKKNYKSWVPIVNPHIRVK